MSSIQWACVVTIFLVRSSESFGTGLSSLLIKLVFVVSVLHACFAMGAFVFSFSPACAWCRFARAIALG
jgi:hypothetical protein